MTPTPFTTADEVKQYIAQLPRDRCWIEPHFSSSYLWRVYCPADFGRMTYGFSTEENLLAWANDARNAGVI